MATKKEKSVSEEVLETSGLSIEDLRAFHFKKIEDSKKITVENVDTPAFDYIANASGGLLMFPDLEAKDKDPASDAIIELAPGEIININSYFSKSIINRHKRHLINAMSMEGALGLPSLLCIESPDVVFPINLVKKNLIDRAKEKGIANQPIELPENMYDVKLQEEYRKEKEYNDKIMEKAGDKTPKRISKADFEKNLG